MMEAVRPQHRRSNVSEPRRSRTTRSLRRTLAPLWVVVALALLALAAPLPRAAASTDRPDQRTGATSASATGKWHEDTLDSGTDVDWWKFTVTADSRIWLTLGSLPWDYNLALYDAAGTKVAQAARTGVKVEEIYRAVKAGHWYVKVFSAKGDFDAEDSYALRLRQLRSTVQVMPGWRWSTEPDTASAVGEVLNNTSKPVKNAYVTVRFKSSSGKVVATESSEVADMRSRSRRPFNVNVEARGVASASITVHYETSTTNPLGGVSVQLDRDWAADLTERDYDGTVTNHNDFTVGLALVQVVQYNSYGNVRDVAYSYPVHIKAGQTTKWDCSFADDKAPNRAGIYVNAYRRDPLS